MISKQNPNRRSFLAIVLGAGGMLAVRHYMFGPVLAAPSAAPFTLTDAQWHQRLTPQQYSILRQQGTEAPFTSPLLHEKGKGIFSCAGCGHPLFSSVAKFDSGTGWPSFWQPLNDKAVQTTQDSSLLMTRTEVHCENCAGHLGHVFDDGPKPTGLRYCMNGAVLKFKPSKT